MKSPGTAPRTTVEEAVRAKPEDEHVAFPGELPVAFDTTGLSQVIPAGKDWLTVALSSAADPFCW